MYKALGLEVRLEPADSKDLGDDCSVCFTGNSKIKMIYTRIPEDKI